ncbi:hypothetical protein ACFODZ_02975 [Marinicella sediminis]|uniref:REase AHJR-like domain-containing protein n=1 Tax=Marinicella sediminis TaxID=1792834 RepID=A0ABV7J952_9GAMM|nr:hypothetical protein [Marinicella sediminis]
MTETNTQRELKKIKDLARDYKSKGFEVSISPKGKAIPGFMKKFNFVPDLIAKSQEETFVIEVSSKESVNRLKELSDLVKAIEKKNGWRFVLVMTNPRESSATSIQSPMPELIELQTSYKKLLKLKNVSENYGRDFDQAILLHAWSIIEGALRMYNYSVKSNTQFRNPKSIVRDTVMYGFISLKEGEFLSEMIEIRNRITHGEVETKISKASLKKLIMLCESLVTEVKTRID